jgi:ribosomal protein L19
VGDTVQAVLEVVQGRKADKQYANGVLVRKSRQTCKLVAYKRAGAMAIGLELICPPPTKFMFI